MQDKSSSNQRAERCLSAAWLIQIRQTTLFCKKDGLLQKGRFSRSSPILTNNDIFR